jgi:mutator protein MutT
MNIQKFAQKGLVVNKNDEFLFIRYAESKFLPDKLNGKWAIPGGKIDMGETPDESIIKEVQEETGVVCRPLDPIYVWNWEYERGEDRVQINAVMRLCEYVEGELLVTKKENELTISEVKWVPRNEVLGLDIVADELVGIEKYLAKN